jgi:hypothetical protein
MKCLAVALLMLILTGFAIAAALTTSLTINGFFITLNSPSDTSTSTTQTVIHIFTPVSTGCSYANCTLFSNYSGTWQGVAGNSSPILDNAVNSITFNYGVDFYSSVWNIYCYNQTNSYNISAPANFTLAVSTGNTGNPVLGGGMAGNPVLGGVILLSGTPPTNNGTSIPLNTLQVIAVLFLCFVLYVAYKRGKMRGKIERQKEVDREKMGQKG